MPGGVMRAGTLLRVVLAMSDAAWLGHQVVPQGRSAGRRLRGRSTRLSLRHHLRESIRPSRSAVKPSTTPHNPDAEIALRSTKNSSLGRYNFRIESNAIIFAELFSRG